MIPTTMSTAELVLHASIATACSYSMDSVARRLAAGYPGRQPEAN
jgi:hypothetical protein